MSNSQPKFHTNAPLSLEKIFDDVYIIPKYQRPYEWTEDHCETLWDDLFSAFRSNTDDNTNNDKPTYFLGIIIRSDCPNLPTSIKDDEVIKAYKKQEVFDVIDGQQRLITLSLLFRALYEIEGKDHGDLRKCLYVVESKNHNNILANHIYTEVLGNTEQQNLANCLDHEQVTFNTPDGEEKTGNKYKTNYQYFYKKINELKDSTDKSLLKDFIDYLLKDVYIISITGSTTEDVLTVFSTINNRGLDLTDGDMFKATLYELALNVNEGDAFIDRWNKLNNELNNEMPKPGNKDNSITFLFRCYMHLKRGQDGQEDQDGDKTSLVALRAFFEGKVKNDKKEPIVKDEYKLTKQTWKKTMDDLEKLKTAWQILNDTNDHEFKGWRYVLETFQNEIWIFPVIVFITTKLDSQAGLSDSDIKECCNFMRNITRYLYTKGFNSQLVEGSTIYVEMFRATIAAAKNKKYSCEIILKDGFENTIKAAISQPKFRRGFCSILEVLKQRTDPTGQYTNVSTNPQVEHILPKEWCEAYYGKWKKDKAEASLDTLGNLCLLEAKNNIQASNKCFKEKKDNQSKSKNFSYTKSNFALVKELIDTVKGDFTYKEYEERHTQCVETLIKFFKNEIDS
jgi:uncharacterized protein with ParB-like and HNH nuclease domain